VVLALDLASIGLRTERKVKVGGVVKRRRTPYRRIFQAYSNVDHDETGEQAQHNFYF
jgi:hypothetical protein